jgi:hypothetical protein
LSSCTLFPISTSSFPISCLLSFLSYPSFLILQSEIP